MSKTIRKKNGLPSEEEALSASTLISFSKICRALCDSNPGLAPYITESYLARLSFEFQYFLESQLGRDSAKPANSVKLPASVFRDYAVQGALHLIMETLIRSIGIEKNSPQRFRDLSKADENLALVAKVKSVLEKNGGTKKKRLYFEESVPRDILTEMEGVVRRHEAQVVSSPAEATHIIEWDSGVDGILPEVLVEEYIRTIEIRRNVPVPRAPENSAPDGDAVGGDPYREGTALVHWWYHPDSYDEWIPSVDVDNSEIPESSFDEQVEDSCGSPVWHVCCRFVRDVELFNEWGNELDYEVDLDKGNGASSSAAANAPAGSSSGRGRGRQGRNRRKLLQTAEEKNLLSKRKADLFSPVLEASVGTEKAVGHLSPPSCLPGERSQASSSASFSVLEVELVDGDVANNEQADLQSACALKTETPSSVWGGDAPAGDIKVINSGESDRKRRRIGNNRHSVSYSSAVDGLVRDTKMDTKLPPGVPSWFQPNAVSSTEVRYMPEFFDGSSRLRSPQSYMSMRSFMSNLYAQNTNTFLSATDCRKKMCGDSGAIIRIHSFLDAFGIINFAVPPEARPPIYPFVSLNPMLSAGSFSTRPQETVVTAFGSNEQRRRNRWSNEDDAALVKAVLEHDDDWHAIGVTMGNRRGGSGITAEDCVVRFAEIPNLPNLHGVSSDKSCDVNVNDACATNATVDGAAESFARKGVLQSLLNEYVSARLAALEEKAKLFEVVENVLNTEQRRLQLDRRDLQVQKAQFSYHQSQHS